MTNGQLMRILSQLDPAAAVAFEDPAVGGLYHAVVSVRPEPDADGVIVLRGRISDNRQARNGSGSAAGRA
jgi:hypothetical protein